MGRQPPLGEWIVPKNDYPNYDIEDAIDKEDLFVFKKK